MELSKCISDFVRSICKNDTCDYCFNRSIASDKKLMERWSKNNSKNPRHVLKYASDGLQLYYFYCSICKHEELRRPAAVQKMLCRYCENQTLCGKEECKFCFDKSIASNEKVMRMWSKNNTVKPWTLMFGSNGEYLLICLECGHESTRRIRSILRPDGKTDRKCVYCCRNTLKLCNNNDCKMCFENSLANMPRSRF